MKNNDLELTVWEIAAKNKMRQLQDAIRDDGMWMVIKKCRETEKALQELRLRAIQLGFERKVLPVS